MIMDVINYLLRLLGLKKDPDNSQVAELEKIIANSKKKLKEIDDEKSDINDIIDRFNK